MTRHSKNCTANTVYTYHERRKDAKNSGYGTQTVRLGKDSIRPFDCCCLTLQPAKDPVITQDGFIYDRAAILEYIISQKADIKRREKIYAKQLDRAQRQAIEKKKAERDEKARAFMALNTLDTHSKASAQAAESAALAIISKGRLTSLESDYKPGTAASFWTNIPSAAESNNDVPDIPKPDTTIRCPMSGKPIRYKDLVTVKFTNFVPDDKGASGNRSTTSNEIRRICAVSSDPLTSATPCFVLRPSGAVVTREVVEKIIKKDMVDPISGSKLTDADLIQVQTGCGGFADGRSVLTATRVAPAESLIDVAREESPQITFESSQLEILETPNDFFNTIENGLKTARSRVVLSTLYLGTGEREERLVKALTENPNKPLVVILADATRSTRPLKFTEKFVGQGLKASPSSPVVENSSSPLFLLQRIANLPNSRASLYQTHKLRGFLYKMLPKRINEVFGLQHMKVYIFDDDVIISGANLSDEYFTTRQDRAWVFRGVSKLAEFYTDLINIVSSLSYLVTPEGGLKANSKETDPILANESAYCSLFQARIEYFLSTAKVKYSSSLDTDSTSFSSVILPLVQMGVYNIRQEVPFVMRILQYLRMYDDNESSLEISLTSGYFCPTDKFEEALVAVAQKSIQPPPKINVLCAAPEANSFFKSRGLSGGIPAAYREMLISFLRRIAQHPSSLNNIQVKEYFRPGWTFHAKGLWINTSSTTLNFVGSSNYGYRSRDLDLETQIVVASNDPKVREKIEAERRRLWDPQYLRPVTVEGLSVSTEPRFKWYARWMLPALRRIM
nr:CDP diacylglycerol glycerol 3 phosphate [Hymenolepis microstoma]